MEPVIYWTTGFLICWLVVALFGLALSPIMDYDGDNELLFRIGDVVEDAYSTIIAGMLLALPVAAVAGFYLIGRSVFEYLS